MRSSRAWAMVVGTLVAGALVGCSDGASLTLQGLTAPTGLKVTPAGLGTVRVEWDDVGSTEVVQYRIERRKNLDGPFATLTRVNRGSGRVIYLDTDVEPETFYGYRVMAVDGLGNESTPSVIEGGKTPPLPGINVVTFSLVPLEIADPDGYTVAIEGPSESRFPIGVNADHRVSPLPVGTYTVRLEGVSAACSAPQNQSLTRQVTVSDQGTATVTEVLFAITCRDATRGELTTGVSVAGGQAPAQAQFTVVASGIATDNTLPESERVFHRSLTYGPGGGSTALTNLRPGAYQLAFGALPSGCILDGTASRGMTVTPLSRDTSLFQVRCGSAAQNQNPVAKANGPYVAEVNQAITFNSTGSSDPDGTIATYSWQFGDQTSGAGATPTKTYTAAGTYTVTLTVTDNRGATATATATAIIGNRVPIAKANGPYAGTPGVPITFSAAGSSDPDGTIASYAWDFGDGATGTGLTATHTYSGTGTFQATLTVTDNRGTTGTATATVTIDQSAARFSWSNTFGTLDTLSQLVPLTLALDLRGNTPATPGIERLHQWFVESLKWDPLVLQYSGFAFAPGSSGSVDANSAVTGSLRLLGTQAPTQNTGLLTLGTVFFRVLGASGTQTTTNTTLTLVRGTVETGGFDYLPETRILEGSYRVGGGPIAVGTVAGTVSRSGGGAVTGVTVIVTPGGGAITNAAGQYTVGNVPVGSGTVRLSNLPAGCDVPSNKPYTLAADGATTTVDFSVTCSGSAPTGTVAGTVARSSGGVVAGATVTVAPGGAAATDAGGQYSIGGVAVGSGTVTLTNLPSGCQAPASKSYTIAAAGATATVDFTVTCTASAPAGTVTGTVTQSGGAGISGATVTVTPGGTATTGSTGTYTVGSVPVGSGNVVVSNLPSGCTAPAQQSYTIANDGQVVTVDFSVTCSGGGQSGTVAGTVTRSTGGAVAGATVTVTPGGTGTTNASGQYSVGSVAVGSGTVTVSNVPSGCTAPAPKPYTIATGGQTATVDFTVTCGSGSPNSFRGTWTVSGNTATLEFRANMTQGQLASLEVNLTVSSSRLQYAGPSPAADPQLGNPQAPNPGTPEPWLIGGFTTNAAGLTGDLGVVRLTFTIVAGAPTNVTPTLTGLIAVNNAFADISSTFQGNVTVDPLTLP